jgi:anti-sigma B factor antagonist
MQADEPVLRIMERTAADGTVVLTVQGEIDLATVGRLEERLSGACERDGAVRIDLRRVRFLDCLGVRLLVAQHERRLARGCRIEFVPGPPVVQRVFELTGMLERLRFVDVARGPRSIAASG